MPSSMELTGPTRPGLDRQRRKSTYQVDPVRIHDIEKTLHSSISRTSSPSPTDSEVDDSPLTKTRAALIMTTVSSINFLNAFNSGILTVGIRHIARDLNIPISLLLWPSSIFALALSCTLLLMGSVADVIGNRPIFIIGVALFTVFTLAVPVCRTGDQLITARALQGIAMSFCLPTSVGIVTTNFAMGRMRNIAFAVLGGGWPIGFSIGLVLGGVLVETIGWRAGYYLSCVVSTLTLIGAWYTVPSNFTAPNRRKALRNDIDWVGVTIASVCMALLSYILSQVTATAAVIHKPENIVLLTIGLLLIPVFIFWVRRQERRGLPAVIPNSIWRSVEFTSICITVFVMWAAFNAFSYWSTLLLQDIQGISAISTSLRFLPLVFFSILTNVVAAALVEKVPAAGILMVGCALSAISPLIFATLNPRLLYWAAEFFAMCLAPVGADLLFNVANLVVTSSFPPGEQARAGGIFNTIAQLGNSFGVAATALLAANVTQANERGHIPVEATLKGYQSAFWMCFAASMVGCFVAALGLRNSGKVGLKRD